MNQKDVIGVLRHIDAKQKSKMLDFFLDFINNFKSEMSFPFEYNENDINERHHENLKLIEKTLIQSGILKGMIDAHNSETPFFKSIGQKLFEIRDNKQVLNQIIGAYNGDSKGNSNYDPNQSLDLILILGKKAFYANKLAKFAGYYLETVLTKNKCPSNEIIKDSIMESIPPDDVFFDYINGKVTDPTVRKGIEDKVKNDLINSLQRKNKFIFTNNPKMESNILGISSQDLMRILTLEYAESTLYTTKYMSIDKLIKEVENFNDVQRQDGLKEIEYFNKYDEKCGKYVYTIDLPYMNIPLMLHVPDHIHNEVSANYQINEKKYGYLSNMFIMAERDVIFGPNFDKNLEEVLKAEKNLIS